MTRDEAKQLLRGRGLRSTVPRLAVLKALAGAADPISHSELVRRLGPSDWDPATVYRNLVKLSEAGLVSRVRGVGGMDRYALATQGELHTHPHFLCEACGRVTCLPDALSVSVTAKEPWAASVRAAALQLRGRCPECIAG